MSVAAVERTVTVELPPLSPGQRAIHVSPARFRLAACGRRFRKTSLGVLELLDNMLHGHPGIYVGPTYRGAAKVAWDMLAALTAEIKGVETNKGEMTFSFQGGSIAVRSADNPIGLRGPGWALAVVDEAAYIPEETWEQALLPTLIDRQGRALLLSSPRGKNWFFRRFSWGQGSDPDWASWKFTTWDNPEIKAEERVSMERAVSEGRYSRTAYRQEFLAEFVEFEGQVFRRIEAAARADRLEVGRDGCSYVIGVDWARTTDATVFAVLELNTKQFVCIERFHNTDYETQKLRLRGLAARFGASRIIAEENSMGGPLIEELRRTLPIQAFHTSNATKATAIELLQLAFESGEVAIPNDPIVMGEFETFERTETKMGAPHYAGQEGCHDDVVMATAIAWQGAFARGRLSLVTI